MTTWSRRLLVLVLAASACTGEPTAVPTIVPTVAPSPSSSSSPTVGPPCTAPPVPGPSWARLADTGIDRLEVAAVNVGARTFIAGGLVDGGATASVEIYPGDTRAPDLPLAVHHAAAVAYRGDVVVIGGFPGPSFNEASDRVFRLRGKTWQEMPRLLRPRAAGGAAVANGAIVVTGGQSGGELLATTEAFDGTAWREVAPMPMPRDHLAVAEHDGFVYAIGGRRRTQDSVLGRVDRYEVATDRWTRVADLPTPRGGMGAARVGDAIVVVGGEGSERDAGPGGVFEQVEALDLPTQSWYSLPDMRTPRHGVGVAGRTRPFRCDVVTATVTAFVGGTRAGLSSSRVVEALTFFDGV